MIPFPKDQALEQVRSAALAAVEDAAQALERAEVPSPARSAIYAEKERQAVAVLDALAIEAELPPHDLVARDMAVDGLTAEEAAEAIVTAAERLRAIAGPLEEWRRGRNAAIRAASTVASVLAVDTSAESLMAALAAEQS